MKRWIEKKALKRSDRVSMQYEVCNCNLRTMHDGFSSISLHSV
jgi:hypothetical protein